jgi:hypothetical protein
MASAAVGIGRGGTKPRETAYPSVPSAPRLAHLKDGSGAPALEPILCVVQPGTIISEQWLSEWRQ